MATTAATMTGAEFDALPYEEGRQWELLEGALIAVPSATWRHQRIVSRILMALMRYLEAGALRGDACPDVEFALADRTRVRPDVFVLLGPKAEALDLDTVPISGAPDLAIEVISPSERAADSYAKVLAYLHNGTAEVWQIYPNSRSVQIYQAETGKTVEYGSEVTSSLLPGFSLPVAALFD